MTKVALITGITGQDGSYLSELLLEKEYIVWGIIRRASSFNTKRIDHLTFNSENKNKFILKYGDMTDTSCMVSILNQIKEKYNDLERLEVYNLAAQSHVQVSFETPEYTAETDAIGVLRILEAIRSSGYTDKIRFYQASTSEMFGKVQEVPQKETTPFYPRSPYGVAKLYAHWIVKNYRESYNMFACSGILFNHETLGGFMPLIFKQNDIIDIKPISEIVKYHTRNDEIAIDEKLDVYQEIEPNKELFIWDDNDWTKVKFASGYPHKPNTNNKNPKFIISKNSAYFTTGEHVIIMNDNSEKKTSDIKINDQVKLIEFNNIVSSNKKYEFKLKTDNCLECKFCNKILSRKDHLLNHIIKCENKNNFLLNEISKEESEFIGLMVGDGSLKKGCIQFTNKDKNVIDYILELWNIIGKKNNKIVKNRLRLTESGFTRKKDIYQLILTGFNEFFRKYIIYNEDKTKKVPYQILNSSKEIMESFLIGYNKADGLKSNNCIYQFKNFKTNSATLAQGLIYLINKTTNQSFNINVEFVKKNNRNNLYYSINMLSNSKYSHEKNVEKYNTVIDLYNKGIPKRHIHYQTGISRKFIQKITNDNYKPANKHYRSKENNTVKKIIDYPNYEGWFYDLETESGKFNAGLGMGRIHNSPRRGETFVTRKITIELGRIVNGESDKLVLGNLDAKRDWGHAKNYVEGMWLMLQQDSADDYVLATNEMRSVREFVEKAFELKGFNIKWKGKGLDEIGYDQNTGRELVFVSEKYYRPCEVDELLGDPSKAKKELGWKLKVSFDELVKEMVENDCKNKIS